MSTTTPDPTTKASSSSTFFAGRPAVIGGVPPVGLDFQDANDPAERLVKPSMRTDRKLRQ